MNSPKPKNTIYLVEVGPGDYKTFTKWPACQAFVQGKPYPFVGGVDHESAVAKLLATRDKQLAVKGLGPKSAPGKKKPVSLTKPTVGICSDCGTHGNPGPCEYKVTDLKGKTIAHKHLGVHTNNYAELAGIEAMIHEAVSLGESQCWTDSQIALGWIKSQRLGPTVREPELVMGVITRINKLLRAHPQIKLLKWETKTWGQIPADFGRK